MCSKVDDAKYRGGLSSQQREGLSLVTMRVIITTVMGANAVWRVIISILGAYDSLFKPNRSHGWDLRQTIQHEKSTQPTPAL